MEIAEKTIEHVCSEKTIAEAMQSLYIVEWTVLQWNGKWYLNTNNEYEIPIRGCPFCRKDLIEGEDTEANEKID